MTYHNQHESNDQDSPFRNRSVLEYLIWEYYHDQEEENRFADVSALKRIHLYS